VFQWFHYACLDKSGKLSARHGNLLCRHCKTESMFESADRERGCSAHTLMQAQIAGVMGGEEMVARMPWVGGSRGVVRPYGIGEVVREEVREADEAVLARGALGEMAFMGYEVARPWIVGEAYLNRHLYVDVVGDEDDEGEEEYYDEDEECEEGWGGDEEEDAMEDVEVK
jgi:hypothetical protein